MTSRIIWYDVTYSVNNMHRVNNAIHLNTRAFHEVDLFSRFNVTSLINILFIIFCMKRIYLYLNARDYKLKVSFSVPVVRASGVFLR